MHFLGNEQCSFLQSCRIMQVNPVAPAVEFMYVTFAMTSALSALLHIITSWLFFHLYCICSFLSAWPMWIAYTKHTLANTRTYNYYIIIWHVGNYQTRCGMDSAHHLLIDAGSRFSNVSVWCLKTIFSPSYSGSEKEAYSLAREYNEMYLRCAFMCSLSISNWECIFTIINISAINHCIMKLCC